MIEITEKDLEFVGIKKKPWIEPPVDTVDPFSPKNKERFSLSAYFTHITCGPYNQDVMANAAGKKGAGKSYSTIELARCCAVRTAISLDNDESKWKDYFDVERNMAVMDMDKMIDILTSNDHHQVIISDDAGTIIGARKWHSEDNQLVNDVLVVNRTNNNIYFSSAPESNHQDKQSRNLPEHQIDFVKNEAGMSCGWATAKYFEKVTDPKTSESYHQYHWWKNAQVLRIVVDKPPKSLTDEYDKLREKGKKLKQEALKAAKEKRLAELDGNGNRKSKRELQAEATALKRENAQKFVDARRLEGLSMKEVYRALESELGIKKKTWESWKYSGYVS